MSCSVELRQRRQQGMAEDPHKLAAMMNKSQRLVLGLLVLLLVDIIWVSSSELTKYIYRDETFEKPFFSTYVRTSMFTLYLLGLCFWPPWREQCNKPATYMFIDPNVEDDNFYSEANTSLSDPTFVPIKTPDHCDRSSGTESDDSSIRSVRFSKLAEVRHMSESDATEALLARLSYQASVRAGEHARRQANKFSVQKVAKIALMFCLFWFMANYTYQLSLEQTQARIVTVLSSTSSLFTLFLAASFPSNGGDKFTLSKLATVVVSIFGLILLGISDLTIKSNMSTGIILALVSAFFYAAYIVFLKRKVDHEDKMDIPMFFGFVGIFNLTLLWPLFFILHYGHWEEFEWPNSHQWTFLIINGLIGTVLSEVLWLWGCFLTSSLIATMAVSLTMPMSMVADVLLKKVEYPCIFYLGSIPMLLAFLTVSLLSYYDNWDPVMDLIKRFFIWICRRNNRFFPYECVALFCTKHHKMMILLPDNNDCESISTTNAINICFICSCSLRISETTSLHFSPVTNPANEYGFHKLCYQDLVHNCYFETMHGLVLRYTLPLLCNWVRKEKIQCLLPKSVYRY